MKLPKSYTLKEIAGLIKAEYEGDDHFAVTGINEIHMVEAGDLTFVDFEKYYDKALNSAATTIIINKQVPCPEGKALIFSDDPCRDYNFLTRYFKPAQYLLNPNIVKGENVEIGEGTIIQPGAVLGNNIKIGKNCVIFPNVVIYDHTEIGDNVIIQAGSIIGSDAFYYKKRPEGYDKMHSCGRTILKSRVEIGANCTIDKGVSGDTIIDEGTKLDNMVHIGHDNYIGKDCIIAAQVGMAGVTKVEDGVIIWGQVGINKEVVIGTGAIVLGQSGVTKSISGGKTYFGTPARDSRTVLKEMAVLARTAKGDKK